MNALLDTSFLYAVNDAKDRNHISAVTYLSTTVDSVILPAPVLPEVCYLLYSRLGHGAMRRFLNQIASSNI
jgi:uncharacterized protein